MALMIDILLWLCIAWTFIMALCMARGIVRFVRGGSKRRIVSRVDYAVGNPLSETGISVLVYGLDEEKVLERRLSLDYLFYEVIVVCDACNEKGFADFLVHYSMMRVEAPVTESLICGNIRSVYRSRERRYRRLMAVDHSGSDHAECFNSALNIASYDYVIPLESNVVLDTDALVLFNSALHQYEYEMNDDCHEIAVIGLSRKVSGNVFFASIHDAVARLMGCVSLDVGFGICEKVVMLPRDAMVARGGFTDSIDMGKHISEYCSLEVEIGCSIAEDLGHSTSGYKIARVLFFRLFWILWIITAIWAVAMSYHNGIQTLVMIVVLAYLAVACCGAIASAIMVKNGYVTDRLRYRTLMQLLVYPFGEFVVLWYNILVSNDKKALM